MPNELMKTLTIGANTYDLPQKTSDLTNDSGFITTESDPTVPSWAKASSKPTYTASEVGAISNEYIGYLENNYLYVPKDWTYQSYDSQYSYWLPFYVKNNNPLIYNGTYLRTIETSTDLFSMGTIYLDGEQKTGNVQLSLSNLYMYSYRDGLSFIYTLAKKGDIPTVPTKVSDLTNDSGFTTNTGTVTSVRVQATSPVQSSTSTAQSTSLNTTISLANGYGDTKNPYASKTKNYVLAAPSNANGVPSFRALVADDIPSLTVSKISDFPTIHTYTAGNEIDITNDVIEFDGYDVTTTTTTLCNETVTTSDEYNPISGDLVYSDLIDADLIKVTFNGIEYICPRLDDSSGYYYGAARFSSTDFSEYPFGLISGSYNSLITKEVGTYTVKIETITDNITVSSAFAKARGYSVVDNPSQVLVNESTTTTNSNSTFNEGTLSYFSKSNDAIKVTFNNVEYICPRINSSYSYGANYNYSSGTFDFSTYPFSLQPNSYDNNTHIYTQTAGTYAVKIENLPKVVVLTDDFKQAIKSSFPGDVMIKGRDYVTAGQKSGSTLGVAATAEGYSTTASGEASHAEGSNTTASGNWSHAEGSGTTASSSWSHAEGSSTTASGMYSHAEGSGTTASGTSSHAEGNHTTANHKSQHVFGEYNVLDPSTAGASTRGNYIEIVGKGTSNSARSNARTLDWNGNEVLAGKLTVGTAPTANMDVATKKYVDDSVATISVPQRYNASTNPTGYLTISDLPLYDGSVSNPT